MQCNTSKQDLNLGNAVKPPHKIALKAGDRERGMTPRRTAGEGVIGS